MYGKVVTIVADRGYGFIESETGERYFFHRSESVNFEALAVDSAVSFTAGESPKGKRATEVVAAV
jgi:cold shock CspA family protein